MLLQVPFKFEGPDSVLQHLSDRVRKKGHAVVLVAEGAGQELLQDEPEERDASGNVLKKDFCSLLNTKIKQHFADHKQPLTLKYIDPSYQIRSVAANAEDSYLCMLLGSGAVHAAMAGFCGLSIGLVNNRTVLIPMPFIIENSPRHLNANGRTWGRVIATTQQPDPMYYYLDHQQ